MEPEVSRWARFFAAQTAEELEALAQESVTMALRADMLVQRLGAIPNWAQR